MTGDPDVTGRPDPFAGAEGVEPFVWATDAGPSDAYLYPADPAAPMATGPADVAEPPVYGDEPPLRYGPRTRVARSPSQTSGLSLALIVTLVVSGPILLIELNWRGSGLTAQPHYLWAAAFGAVALAFVAGGAVVGYRAASTGEALVEGLAVAVLSCGLLVLTALVRQLVVGKHFPHSSTYLWFVIEIGVLCWFACGGALLGRLVSLRLWEG